ncbi:MAG TPA: hypothetical protein VFO79_08715, partial [Xanthomonadales bacterium]|nr:hypothetical protein [Xanthomonadales bacterium]
GLAASLRAHQAAPEDVHQPPAGAGSAPVGRTSPEALRIALWRRDGRHFLAAASPEMPAATRHRSR